MYNPDYIVVGGGLAGCVLASRLAQYSPESGILLIEAGPDEHNNPLITEPQGIRQLHMSRLQYDYKTEPQEHLDGRRVFQAGGRLLSGTSAVNYSSWSRGDRADYDTWADMVDDKRWAYDGLLPYFRKTEHHHDPQGESHQHGFRGPIHSSLALNRTYPLTEQLSKAYDKVGIHKIVDHNSGSNQGMAPHVEIWYRGKRQPAGLAYGLQDVEVLTERLVKRVVMGDTAQGIKRATGIECTTGETFSATKEVIVCCGAIRSPQLLMLSGIGPPDDLQKHGIEPIIKCPEAGRNLWDHCAFTQYFRVKNPERGLCSPHPAFNHPSYGQGLPTDYIITESVPSSLLPALRVDSDHDTNITDTHPLLERSHYEILPMYAPANIPFTDMRIPRDGSILSVGILNLLPTSRGRITLASSSALAEPLLDPKYLATETDRVIMRTALRRNISAFETPEASAIIDSEVTPEDYPALTNKSSDEEVDARIRRTAATFYHTAGSCSMGKVVDTECRVIGVKGLRVVDASVVPTPISAHPMVCVYALAEQMAEIIAKEIQKGSLR